jgi:hypothetical protein
LALLIELQPQLHETQFFLSTHVDKARVLETVFAEHSTIKREVGVLCQLAEKWIEKMEIPALLVGLWMMTMRGVFEL